MKHCSRPWKVKNFKEFSLISGNKNNETICKVWNNVEANSNLIVNAPEMLKLLENILDILVEKDSPLYLKTEKLIKKARGQK